MKAIINKSNIDPFLKKKNIVSYEYSFENGDIPFATTFYHYTKKAFTLLVLYINAVGSL